MVKFISFLLLSVLSFGLVSPGLAQEQASRPKAVPSYNRFTETVVKGTVSEVTEGASAVLAGTHLTVSIGTGTIQVHAAPSRFLERNNFAVIPGDQIEVIGSAVKHAGSDILLARIVKKGDKVLVLRNSQGIPLWVRARHPHKPGVY